MPSQSEESTATSDGGPSKQAALEQQLEDNLQQLSSLWLQFDQLATHFQQWSKNSIELFLLELKTSLAAIQQSLLLSVVLILLSVFFLISLSAGIALLVYYSGQGLLLAYASFLLALGLILIAIVYRQKSLAKLIGFRHSSEQLKEGLNVILQQQDKSH